MPKQMEVQCHRKEGGGFSCRKDGQSMNVIPLPYISIITHYCGFVKRIFFFLCVDAVIILPHLHMKDIE